MLHMCIGDLAKVVGGTLTLASLPPLAGLFEPVRRVVVDSRSVQAGDVFWGVVSAPYDGSRLAEDAFMRGALGVVVAGRHVEPWAGRFALEVDDANAALVRLAQYVGLDHGKDGVAGFDALSAQLARAALHGGPPSMDALLARWTEDITSYAM